MAKKKDLKEQNPDYTIDLIELFAGKDPSNSNKYLPFMIEQTKEWLHWFKLEIENETFQEIFNLINDFENLSERNLLKNKDIYSYSNNSDIIEAVKEAKEHVTRSEVKKKETRILFEDDNWLVLMPLSVRSSNLYGRGTKWCVSSTDHNYERYYNQYTENGILIFVIDKTAKEKDSYDNIFSKIAFHNDRNKKDGLTIWDVKDNQLSLTGLMTLTQKIGDNLLKIINEELVNGKPNKEYLITEKKTGNGFLGAKTIDDFVNTDDDDFEIERMEDYGDDLFEEDEQGGEVGEITNTEITEDAPYNRLREMWGVR